MKGKPRRPERPPRRRNNRLRSLSRGTRTAEYPERETLPVRSVAISEAEKLALADVVASLVDPSARAQSIQLLERYVEEILVWNARGNLIARGDEPRIVRRHVVESLACVPLIDDLSKRRLLDVGSGAGLPGIPLKIVRPALEVVLVESRRMKSLFLRRAIAKLSLEGVEVRNSRIENLASVPGADPAHRKDESPTKSTEATESSARFEIVTARAVARLEQISRWVTPVVKPGGFLVAFKGSRVDEELESWSRDPGPWVLVTVRRDVAPHLNLVVLRMEASEKPAHSSIVSRETMPPF